MSWSASEKLACAAMELALQLEDNRLFDEMHETLRQINSLKSRLTVIEARRNEIGIRMKGVEEMYKTMQEPF